MGEREAGTAALAPSALTVGSVLALVGLTAFGGPAAHVALMRRAVVDRRRWVATADFNRIYAACNLIPGPSSTELAMVLGYRLAGIKGLLISAAAFVSPAIAIMLVLAALYQRFGGSHAVQQLLYGARPVVVGIVAWAGVDLARKLLQRRWLVGLAPVGLVLYFLGLNPVLILALAGLAGLAIALLRGRRAAVLATALCSPHPERLMPLFLTFLKIGAVAFGSGYVLFVFLQSDFVAGFHWLARTQLVDAVAIGQVTPGPVFTTATFLGFLFAGIPGALLATIAIFLPGLLLVPLVDRFMRVVDARPELQFFLDAVNAAVIGLIAAVGVELGRASLVDPRTAGLAVVALVVVWWRPLAAPLLVLAGALAGLLLG